MNFSPKRATPGASRSPSSSPDFMKRTELVSFINDDALAVGAAESWLDAIDAAKAAGRTHLVALSGGRVARKFFSAAVKLAMVRRIDFGHVHFFWADERCVPPDDVESNFRLADEALFQPGRVPAGNIHRIRGELAPQSGAQLATAELRAIAKADGAALPVLDLVLLGLGEDGHVASLFPGHAATEADLASIFLAVTNSPKPPPNRVSLGHGPMAAAKAVWVLASGQGKQPALGQSLAPGGKTPLAQVIQRRTLTKIFTDVALK
jgi:6-phosphogluconolactonase